MPNEIRAFFEQYAEAFNALDGDAVASLFACPSGIVDHSSFEYWATAESVRRNMAALCALYRDSGYISASFEPGAFIAQGERFAVADVSWHIHWREREPSSFNTTYNLVRKPEGWRVLLCTAYSEPKPSSLPPSASN